MVLGYLQTHKEEYILFGSYAFTIYKGDLMKKHHNGQGKVIPFPGKKRPALKAGNNPAQPARRNTRGSINLGSTDLPKKTKILASRTFGDDD